MITQGWRVVSPDVAADLKKKGINYLPQYDLTLQKPDKKLDYSRLDSSTENNLLEIEVI